MIMGAVASVILPVYNGEQYLEEMLDSIWKQSYRPIQLIICDDCSTDGSNFTIQAWCRGKRRTDFFIETIHNKRNLGLSANISNALFRAEGDYIFFADQDDIWMDEKIENQIDYLHKNPDCMICQCDRSIINEQGKLLYRSENSLFNYMTVKKNLKMVLRTPSAYAANCICLRADCLKEIIPIPDKVVEPDSYIAAIAAHYGNIGYLYKPLVQYRIHKKNLSHPYFPKLEFNFIECYKRHISGTRRYNRIVKNDDAILKEVLMNQYQEDLSIYRDRKVIKRIYLHSFFQTLKRCSSVKANKRCRKKPVISVLMTIYKDKEYLKEAIKSIVDQSYRNWEFLIIAEPDTPEESLEIIRSFSDKRIRLIINKKHLGFSESLNKGIKLAKGKYIARMDADDISLPNRFIFQLVYMSIHVKTAVCGSNVVCIDKTGKELHKSKLPLRPEEIAVMFHFENVIYHPSVMFRKEVFIYNNFFYKSQSAEDYELWTRICRNYRIANVPMILLKRRMHGENAVLEQKKEIYHYNLITQRNLWESKKIEFLLDKPWYDKTFVTRDEKDKRRKMIHNLRKKTPYFINKKKRFKELIKLWGE